MSRGRASFRSGNAFTPSVAGDLNGDGYFNDRAFIYAPSASDTAVGNGMQRLLANASSRDAELSRVARSVAIASRNSCRAPWSSSASLTVALDRVKFHMPRRANVSFSLSNPLGAADLIANGSSHLQGWGQAPIPDAQLLYVARLRSDHEPLQVRSQSAVRRDAAGARHAPQSGRADDDAALGSRRVTRAADARDAARLGTHAARHAISRRPSSAGRHEQRREPDGVDPPPAGFSEALVIPGGQHRVDESPIQLSQRFACGRRSRGTSRRCPRGSTAAMRTLATSAARRAQVGMLMDLAPRITELLTPEQRRKLPSTRDQHPRSAVPRVDPGRHVALCRRPSRRFGRRAPSSVVNGQIFFEFSR